MISHDDIQADLDLKFQHAQAAGFNDPAIMIYQMGKVGSQSLKSAFQTAYPNVAHMHKHERAKKFITDRAAVKQPVLLFCGVREPLSRCMSACFQNICNPINAYWYLGDEKSVLNTNLEDIRAHFDVVAPKHVTNFMAPWFDSFQETTGFALDDLALVENGFWFTSTPDISVFFYKLEEMAEFYRGLQSFSQFHEIPFGVSNTAEDKKIFGLYRALQQSYSITPQEYQSKFGDISWLSKFYDADELAALTARWIKE
ncbi:hypothetical protein [Ruegeria arenilitoris]|uniref:hypothetical protein n=1 Tax=Ruegeria arenilitoris TaxID=1173585 RepID=UPI00147F8A08|nr:hypothetical protein [Ruegeria arenilitoris]